MHRQLAALSYSIVYCWMSTVKLTSPFPCSLQVGALQSFPGARRYRKLKSFGIACFISSEICTRITFSHAFSFWEVSEESSRNSQEFKGECDAYGKAGCWRQQKGWKGRSCPPPPPLSILYLKIVSCSRHWLIIVVFDRLNPPRLQRRCPKI